MKRIGIFGGTFNPVHNGHIHLARAAYDVLKLDKLIIVPSNIPPHKPAEGIYPNDIRLEMCRLAFSDYPDFEVSEYEMKRTGKSYSIYTAQHFSHIYPECSIFMIVGSDMFLSFDKWYMYKDILKLVSLAVVSRNANDIEQLENKATELSKYGNINIIRVPSYPVSSTQIRCKIKNNEKYSCYLPQKVVQYISLNNLYR